jgi:hypothetical protein
VVRHQSDVGIRHQPGAALTRPTLAPTGCVPWLVKASWLASICVAIGVLGATLLIASHLHGIRLTDPLAIGAVAVVLLIVAAMASYVPHPACRWHRPADRAALRVISRYAVRVSHPYFRKVIKLIVKSAFRLKPEVATHVRASRDPDESESVRRHSHI